MNSVEFRSGVDAFNLGKSIHYNPFRHRGTSQQYSDWESGWLCASKGEVLDAEQSD